ncbi:MAG: Dam family site-specific DNA-(adenine-N6)-methyltransferase [Pleurocapsa sp.]
MKQKKIFLPVESQKIINKSFSEVSPVLKWAGGKTQLLPQIKARYPAELQNNEINAYIEPFVGGGAVFFDIVNNFSIERAYLFDINPELIVLYKVIQKNVADLIEELTLLSDKYLPLRDEERKIFYYDSRDRYNYFDKKIDTAVYQPEWIKRAALTVFLNRTCFNGLYRVNKQGAFNVPMGKYKNPKILNIENLLAVNQAFQIACIKQADFSEVLKYASRNTFIYYDPPYRPISKTASFNSYSSSQFNDDEQKRLRNVFKEASDRGALQMLSNSDPSNYIEDSFFDDLYQEFKIKRISASRAINSKGSKRGSIKELLITNY